MIERGDGEDERGEDIPQKCILVPNQRQCLCELSLRICIVLEGLRSRRTHVGSRGLVLARRRSLLLDRTEEGAHRCQLVCTIGKSKSGMSTLKWNNGSGSM